MKCNKCNYVWDLFKEDNYKCCPKCQDKFIAKYQNFDSVSEGLAYCLKVGGRELLQNQAKLNSYISDLMGNSFPDRNLIKNAVESDVGSILLEADGKKLQEQRDAISRAADRMVCEFSTDPKKAEEIVMYFAVALQWKLPSATSISKEKNSTTVQAPQKENAANTVINANAGISSSSDSETKYTTIQQKTNIDNEYEKLASLTLAEKNREVVPTVKGMVVTNNAVVVKKKKSPLPWILLFLLLIGAAGGWYYWSSLQNSQSIGLGVPLPTDPSESKTSETIIAEKQTEAPIAEVIMETSETTVPVMLDKTEISSETSAEMSTEVVTEITVPATSDKTEVSTETPPMLASETTTETATEGPLVTDTLFVTNLLTLGEYTCNVGNGPQQLHYNFTNNTLFCRNGSNVLYLIDFSTNTYSTYELVSDWIGVNPHNGHMYVFSGYYDSKLSDITSGIDLSVSSSLYHDPVYFKSSTEIVCSGMIISLETGEKLVSGYIPGFNDTYDNRPELFLYNGDYYYYYQGGSIYPSAIVKSTQILTTDGAHTLTKELTNYKDIIAHHVSTDAVYYMTTDHSIYRVNLEGDDILLIDGSSIQNTGSAYLSGDIKEFVRITDSCFVVFDNLDKTVKLLGELPS